MIALFLTLIFPGLGHFYYGKNRKALILVAVSLVPFVYPFSLVYALYDTYRIHRSGRAPELSRREAITVVLVGIALPVALGIMLVVVAPGLYRSVVSGVGGTSYPETNRSTMDDIAHALEKYHDRNGRYPEDLDGIIRDNPLRKKWLADPWGSLYRYETDAGRSSYQLISAGKDKAYNTADDIVTGSKDNNLVIN